MSKTSGAGDIGKTGHVLVTGGSRGLGLALVQALLAAGYRVSTCSRQPSQALNALLSDHSDRLYWQAVAVDDAVAAEKFLADAVAWGNGLYGLINNAGIAREGILATFPEVETDALLAVNLAAPIRLARAALRHMLGRSGPGRIINISSIIGQRGYTGLCAYAATKAGLDGFTRALAREVGRRGITVNSIAPGYLDTEMSGSLDASRIQQIVRRTPLERLGTPADVTPLALFLLGDGGRFITGQTLTVDGGITC